MNIKLEERLDLLSENVLIMKNDFIWQNALIKRLAAMLYAAENRIIDSDSIRECHELIKKNTGLFSSFRGNLAICIATLLSLSGDRDDQLSGTLTVYDIMKDLKFRASDYLVLAAYQIASNTDSTEYRHVVERTRAFYDGMKENHWFYTGRDDYIFAAMLGMSDIDVKVGVDRMQLLHEQLKPEFSHGNSIQALTQVLVLGESGNGIVTRLIGLRDTFRDKNIRLDKEYTLSSLGVLSLLPDGVSTIVNDVSESYEFLRGKKGFGKWSVTKQELLLFCAAIVTSIYIDDIDSGILTTSLSTSITNIIIAQQTAIAAAAASSAAVASSSSG